MSNMRDTKKDRKLCDAATKGPWVVIGRNFNIKGFPQVEMNTPDQKYFPVHTVADAEFIAEAREALPWYIDRVEELEVDNKRLKEKLSKCDDDYVWE